MTKSELKKMKTILKLQKTVLIDNIITMHEKSAEAYDKYGSGKIEPNTITIKYMGPVVGSLVELVSGYETYIEQLEKALNTKHDAKRKKKSV